MLLPRFLWVGSHRLSVRLPIALIALSILSFQAAAVERRYRVSEDAERPILSLGWSGGSLESPRFTLYGDGRLIGQVSLPGHPPLREPVEIVLSHDDMRAIIDSVVEAGLVEFSPGDQDRKIGPRLNLIADSSSLVLEVSLESYEGPRRREASPFVHWTGIDSPHEEITRYREAKTAGRVADTEPDTFVEAETLLHLYETLREMIYPVTLETSEPAVSWDLGVDDERDNVPNRVENDGPNTGDGNGDGYADATQSSVASLPNAIDRGYVTLASISKQTMLAEVRSIHPKSQFPSFSPLSNRHLPVGILSFELQGTPALPDSVVVDVLLPEGSLPITHYYVYDEASSEWDELLRNATPGFVQGVDQVTGRDKVTLTLVDGALGDADLNSSNNVIVHLGGPAILSK